MAVIDPVRREIRCKLAYYGLSYCGKSTNLLHLHQMMHMRDISDFTVIDTEIERLFSFDLLLPPEKNIHGLRVRLQLCASPASILYKHMRTRILSGADGVILVVDSQASRLRENIFTIWEELQEYLRDQKQDITTFPLAIQWNKRDLPESDILPVSILERYLNPYRFPAYEAVARTGQGVRESLDTVISQILQALVVNPEYREMFRQYTMTEKREREVFPALLPDVHPARLSDTHPREMDLAQIGQDEIALIRANLSGVNWSGVNLSRALLNGSNLSEANLSGADLSEASLYGVRLHNANLRKVNLHNANLGWAWLVKADLRWANLEDAALSNASAEGADLQEAILHRATLQYSLLHEANLSGADLSGADLSGADLHGSNLRGANLHGANLHLRGANLSNADLSGADLSGADLHGSNLHGANLHGAKLHKADLSGADLSEADLSGALLTGTNLTGACLKGACLRGIRSEEFCAPGADFSGADLRGIPWLLIMELTLQPGIVWKNVLYDRTAENEG
ncbi:pentapeptide repeat-containing protein [Ktedonobacter sp. SOSP1-85]|uniref:pentapeptide repeat-containing protein n=1 Tax=Ktedonobacter sp. SOSP1-85 TaxID=2778367 RepID=UPI001F2D4FB1|nr:pentapeptide repeat-containing protein [Ktedonobacter sp. SOSP1-85]